MGMNDPAGGASQPAPLPTQGESTRETIESIVIALILAFVFRAFIIEAFVIPTGSMAATLNGAHGTMICQDCGWEFAYGLTDASSRGGPSYDANSVAVCPNCRFPNQTVEINDTRGNYESGDRILVLKWTYDLGGATLGPRRWDVVVFKDPSDGVTNYIKRLAGLPDEVLQIIDGDVYTVPFAQVSAERRATLEEDRHIKYLRRLYDEINRRDGKPRINRDDLPREIAHQLERVALDRLDAALEPRRNALLAELDGKLRICRKTENAQRDLWQVVYDHDYPPREWNRDQPRWLADEGSAWTVGNRTLRFEGVSAAEQNVLLSAEIDSTCAYNTLLRGVRMRQIGDGFPVADLRIRYVIDYRSGDGSLAAELSKRGDHFRGELSADGTVRLLHATADTPGQWRELAKAQVDPLKPGRKVEFEMENLDYRVRVLINGDQVLATTDAQYAPDVATLRGTVQLPATLPPTISAAGLDVELSHAVVERDIYYGSMVDPGAFPLRYHPWGVQNHPIVLRAGEYFMLGDNSAQSKDSRLWNYVGDHLLDRGEDYQLGTVPHDQLIGRAFFVYWPSGLRTSIVPFLREVGWIPNFGRMRWIR